MTEDKTSILNGWKHSQQFSQSWLAIKIIYVSETKKNIRGSRRHWFFQLKKSTIFQSILVSHTVPPYVCYSICEMVFRFFPPNFMLDEYSQRVFSTSRKIQTVKVRNARAIPPHKPKKWKKDSEKLPHLQVSVCPYEIVKKKFGGLRPQTPQPGGGHPPLDPPPRA